MIALRGELRRENDTWKWKGVWAYGSIPKDATLATHSRKTKNPSARPFVYTWDQPCKASSVLVPSANLPKIAQEEKKTEASDVAIETKESTVHKADESKDKALDRMESMDTLSGVSETDMELEGSASKNDSEPSVRKSSGDPVLQVSTTDDKNDEDKTKAEKSKDENVGEGKLTSAPLKMTEESVTERGNDGDKATQPRSEMTEDGDEEKKMSAKTSAFDDKADANDEGVKEKDGAPVEKKSEEDAAGGESTVSVAERKRGDVVTYASSLPDEPPYTEASTLHKEKCPLDGSWNGYFENVSTRKDRNSSRVPENFCLFFNATPAKDARVLFRDTDDSPETTGGTGDSKGESETAPGMLPSGYVHVRGKGTNQFGTFELLGCLNLASGILECQRMYVITADEGSSSSTRRRVHPTTPGARVARPRSGTDGMDSSSTITPRAYNTRKRQFSWKRANVSDDDDDDDEANSRRSTSSKKRSRTAEGRKSPISLAGALLATTTPKSGTRASITIPTSSGVKRPGPSPRSASRKRPSPSQKSSTPSSVASPNFMKLPVAGDPRQARWRAAHFLYYQRNDPSADESGGSAAASSNITPNYVVYEGEMIQGESLRDGRGVCLYSNGTLYEGEWKRNKEHGWGKLMTADRKRTIYKGEWERGRMHGKGTYYYSHDSPLFMRRNVEKEGADGGCRYEGDFKENARHGSGKYVLPNGAVYDGEWRDNVMSGRGTFNWVDGSVYVGQWKGGKRNGQGTLRTSDGFTYDGTWVQNAMEGRGIATYPNGQRYEGMWVGGKRDGRGTIRFTNGAIYEGRFRDDAISGQGTMKMHQNVVVPRPVSEKVNDKVDSESEKDDWMIPIHFQSDLGRIHEKAGFTTGGE